MKNFVRRNSRSEQKNSIGGQHIEENEDNIIIKDEGEEYGNNA